MVIAGGIVKYKLYGQKKGEREMKNVKTQKESKRLAAPKDGPCNLRAGI